MLEVRKSMLCPTPKPSSANVRYDSKTPGKGGVLTHTLPACLRFHSLIVESQVVTPTLSRDYFSVDNKLRVSCVQWYGEQKSEGTPRPLGQLFLRRSVWRQQPRRSSGVILLRLSSDLIGAGGRVFI